MKKLILIIALMGHPAHAMQKKVQLSDVQEIIPSAEWHTQGAPIAQAWYSNSDEDRARQETELEERLRAIRQRRKERAQRYNIPLHDLAALMDPENHIQRPITTNSLEPVTRIAKLSIACLCVSWICDWLAPNSSNESS